MGHQTKEKDRLLIHSTPVVSQAQGRLLSVVIRVGGKHVNFAYRESNKKGLNKLGVYSEGERTPSHGTKTEPSVVFMGAFGLLDFCFCYLLGTVFRWRTEIE